MLHAQNLPELRDAARSLEQSIKDVKTNNSGSDVNPYRLQYPSGAMVLAPMLAAQITILNQIEKLEVERGTRPRR